MNIKRHKNWTLVAIVGLAFWLFGNLYEEIVIAPNWVVNSPLQLRRLHDFFINTSPTIYFVPVTQMATIMVWVLAWFNKDVSVRSFYTKASIFACMATGLNIFIVSTIITKIFGSDFEQQGDYLGTLCWRWNFLNLFRMALVAITISYLFNAYRKLDRY